MLLTSVMTYKNEHIEDEKQKFIQIFIQNYNTIACLSSATMVKQVSHVSYVPFQERNDFDFVLFFFLFQSI